MFSHIIKVYTPMSIYNNANRILNEFDLVLLEFKRAKEIAIATWPSMPCFDMPRSPSVRVYINRRPF